MSSMYKIFYSILAAGGLGGVVFAFWSLLFNEPRSSFWVFVALSSVVGLVIGFVNYIFVKAVLRVFVNKFHTLERVLVGTDPEELPNVFVSNEIDEMERSMVRITEQFDKLSTSMSIHGSTPRGRTLSAPTGRKSVS